MSGSGADSANRPKNWMDDVAIRIVADIQMATDSVAESSVVARALQSARKRLASATFLPVLTDHRFSLQAALSAASGRASVQIFVPTEPDSTSTSRRLSGQVVDSRSNMIADQSRGSGSSSETMVTLSARKRRDPDSIPNENSRQSAVDPLVAEIQKLLGEEHRFELIAKQLVTQYDVIHAEAAILNAFDVNSTTKELPLKSNDTPLQKNITDVTLVDGMLQVQIPAQPEVSVAVVTVELNFETARGRVSVLCPLTLNRSQAAGAVLTGWFQLDVPRDSTSNNVSVTVRSVTADDLMHATAAQREMLLDGESACILTCRARSDGIEMIAMENQLRAVIDQPRAVLGLLALPKGGLTNG